MKLKGNYDFKVSRTQLWIYLMDPIVLVKITPGVSRLETLGEDKFKSISVIKIGPVKASFIGKLKVVDKNHPASFVIKMEQLGKIGNAHVSVQMNIDERQDGIAALTFDGKAEQRVLSGVANVITRQVFSALEKLIDLAALEMEMDPTELRFKNFIPAFDGVEQEGYVTQVTL
ncbi:MAG: carbon monoxide dehydrogenase subunit G [Granulosicoccus sp.]|jgi:carbon monoxide dehydrogenase subunit G